MAGIIKTSINLDKIPKEKIVNGKKGVNDEVDQFGNQGPVVVDQTKEERDTKAEKVYLGNCKVVWTNGTMPEPPPYDGAPAKQAAAAKVQAADDLPF
jgi:hypothetical protein